jgi:hypothetical protein
MIRICYSIAHCVILVLYLFAKIKKTIYAKQIVAFVLIPSSKGRRSSIILFILYGL